MLTDALLAFVPISAPLSLAFFGARFPLWFGVTFGYTAFWHVTLYAFKWAERPFIANRAYSVDKVAHNIAWSASGIAIWVAFENMFAYLWATGRLAYTPDVEVRVQDGEYQTAGVWTGMLFVFVFFFFRELNLNSEKITLLSPLFSTTVADHRCWRGALRRRPCDCTALARHTLLLCAPVAALQAAVSARALAAPPQHGH